MDFLPCLFLLYIFEKYLIWYLFYISNMLILVPKVLEVLKSLIPPPAPKLFVPSSLFPWVIGDFIKIENPHLISFHLF